MSRGQKKDSDAALLVDELKAEIDEGTEDKVESSIDLIDTPPAVQPKATEKKVWLVLVKAATYADVAAGGVGRVKKGVPFEADESIAKSLLATGLFKEA
ncbi:MAG: hypothetical protein LBS45_04410 [Synergistaceae bacterium]|jgi:hypothetical protein|nr:hypothetical protein [Synergistaceae bacterium]